MRVKQLFFLVMAGVFLFAGCNNLADKRNQVKEYDVIDDILPEKSESEQKIAYLKISGAEIAKADRTIKPEFSLESIANFAFVLSGEKSDNIGNILDIASFENYEQLMEKPIPIEEGLWNLTLTASAEGTILKGIKNNVTIVSGDNSLDFVLKWDSEASTGTGKLELTFDFSEVSNRDNVAVVTGEIYTYNPLTKEEISLHDIDMLYPEEITLLSNGSRFNQWSIQASYCYTFDTELFVDKNYLSSGVYIVKIRLYADSEKKIPINTWRETVIISGGQTSRATRSVSSLNKVYSITYYDGDENISDGFQTKYTRICSDITLPTPIKSGYAFFGWYTKPDFSDEKVTTIPKGSTGDLTLYAKWDDSIKVTIESTELELSYEKQKDSILFTVTGGEGYYAWYVDDEMKQNGSSAYTFPITTEGTYEIEVRNGSYSATAFIEITDVFINGGFVLVNGGTFTFDETNTLVPESSVFVNGSTVTIPDIYVCNHEVTQQEYETYCYYGGITPSDTYGLGNLYPAYNISWYDAVVYCNLRSISEGYTPVYSIENETDPAKWEGIKENSERKYCGPSEQTAVWESITVNPTAKGYRLPTGIEWEYLYRGGQNWNSYTYSGSDNVDDVAWYNGNTEKANEVMQKDPNIIGLYDMSGNVWEWIFEHNLCGGSWYNAEDSLMPNYRLTSEACNRSDDYNDFGFRVVRNAN